MRKLGFLASALAAAASAATLQVGPDKPYPAPCAAIAVAHDGDTILIDAGLYVADVCAVYPNNLSLIGVNGRAHLEAHDAAAQGKAIWVIKGHDVLVQNIEFSGASVPDHNGAGIRAEGVNLTVRNCYFHDNQDGILESNVAGSTIDIRFSEFNHNGFGDGHSHNLYIGHAAKLIFWYNWSHNAKVGHLLKSRAAVNDIRYNRLSDDKTGNASYELDLPNGGDSLVLGNIIQQSKNTDNSTILAFAEEGATNPVQQLLVINNTFVNDRPHGGTFAYIAAGVSQLTNNIFDGVGTMCSGPGCTAQSFNFTGDPSFVNPTAFDYHLKPGSPAIDYGTLSLPFTPDHEYLHPACGEARALAGQSIDAGAFEFGGAGAPLACR